MEPQVKRKIIRYVEQGISEADIASSLDTPENMVRLTIESYKNIISVPRLNPAKKARVFELLAEGLSVTEVALVINTNELCVERVIEKDRKKVKADSRATRFLEMYKEGSSLEEIGTESGLTRERVRQLTKKQFGFDLGYGPLEQRARKKEIDVGYREIVRGSRGERQEDSVNELVEKALEKGLTPEYFDSMSTYTNAIGVTASVLKEHRPDIYNVVMKNARLKSQRWSWHYDECRMCHTTTAKHKTYGYCVNCYFKSPEFKSIQKRSHEKNRDQRLAQNKVYAEDYYNRPEVKEKLEQEYDDKYFGGNRKFALERDGYKCLGCGMSVTEKDTAGRAKVRVWHLKDKDDHSLENLGTYCQACLYKELGLNPFNNFGRSR